MGGLEVITGREIGDGACNFQDAIVAAGTKTPFLGAGCSEIANNVSVEVKGTKQTAGWSTRRA